MQPAGVNQVCSSILSIAMQPAGAKHEQDTGLPIVRVNTVSQQSTMQSMSGANIVSEQGTSLPIVKVNTVSEQSMTGANTVSDQSGQY